MAYSTKNCIVNEKEAKWIRLRELFRKERLDKVKRSFVKAMEQIKQEKRES